MLRYSVETVPCFVALDAAGHAIARSGPPRGAAHVTDSLSALARLLRGRR